jgi:parvulin-like peptidyl-prolyl isomerase
MKVESKIIMKTKLFFLAALAAALSTLPGAYAVTGSLPPAAASAPAPDATATNSKPSDVVSALFGDPVIAQGKDVVVKQSQLDDVVTGIKSEAAAHGQSIPPEQMPMVEASCLMQLIQTDLLLQEATDADKAQGKQKTDARLAQVIQKVGSQAEFDEQLKAIGMTEDQFRAKVTQNATAMITLQRELGVNATDADAMAFYSNNPAKFEVPEQVHVRHILLMTIDPGTQQPLPEAQQQAKRKQIDEILKRARAGEDFAALVKQYSDDPGSKNNGGEYTFSRGQMVPEFEAAAFSLTNNQISDVVTSQFGYHIIQLLGHIPARKLAPTDELPSSDVTVLQNIKDYLNDQQTKTLAPAYLDKLTKAANVQILDPTLKAAVDAQTNAPPALPAQ